MSADGIPKEVHPIKTEAEVRAHLSQKAETDSAFRARLLADPKETVEQELGLTLPGGFVLEVHEETATSAHLVVSPQGGRLSPAELAAVSGGNHETGIPPAPGPWNQ